MTIQHQTNNDFLANLLMYGGIASVAVILYVAAFDLQFPLWLAIIVGAGVGSSLIFNGMRFHSGARSNSNRVGVNSESSVQSVDIASGSRASNGFWPSPSEAWGMLGLLGFSAILAVPLLFFLPLLWLVHAGDTWPIVMQRIAGVTLAVGASRWWIAFANDKLCNFFTGKVSDETIDSFVQVKRPKEPRSVVETAKANWEFLVLPAIAFSLAYFFAYHNHPKPIPEFGARSTSGIAKTLVWCHDNPNTVVTASLLVGGGALVLYVYRVIRESVRSRNF